MGQLVNKVNMVSMEGSNVYDLNLSSLNNGLYLVEVINGGSIGRERFEIAR
jgi:hypothetical protein